MPHARTLDPSTSHQAAATVSNLTEVKKAILDFLQTAMCDEDLVRHIDFVFGAKFATPQSIRSRRAELVRDGFVEDSGGRTTLASGRKAIMWVRA
jgi:hypothetical protein